MKIPIQILSNDKRSILAGFSLETEVRGKGKNKEEQQVIVGYALRYDEWSETMGIPGWFEFKEKIAPGAAREAISKDNVDLRALFNHDSSKVLGRVSAGTLEVEEDDFGVRYKIIPPDTSYGRDLVKSIERGDVKESSFAFVLGTNEGDDEWDEVEEGVFERTIHRFDKILEVSPVTFPAYPSASSGIREVDKDKYREVIEIVKQKRTWQNELRLRKLALEEY